MPCIVDARTMSRECYLCRMHGCLTANMVMQMDSLADSFGGGSLDLAIMQEAPLTAALLTRCNNSLPLGNPAHR